MCGIVWEVISAKSSIHEREGTLTNGEVALDALWKCVALRLEGMQFIKWRGVALGLDWDRSTMLYMIYCS